MLEFIFFYKINLIKKMKEVKYKYISYRYG